MIKKIIEEIRAELSKLADKSYADEQYVVVEKKQLKQLRSLLEKASSLQKEPLRDLTRCVHDYAPDSSQLSRLTTKLYDEFFEE